MTNNQIFRKLYHLLGLSRDIELAVEIFKMGGKNNVTKHLVERWRRPDEHNFFLELNDFEINAFFDGLFVYRDMQRLKNIEIFNLHVKQ